MTEPICALDLARMRRDRVAKLHAAMEAAGVDTLVLCGQTERLVRDRRARARGRPHARVVVARGRACSNAARRGLTSTPTFPRARPTEMPDEFLHRAIEVETGRGRARARRDDSARAGWRSTTRRSRSGTRSAPRELVDASAVLGAREAHEDARRARVHPPGAGDQRGGDARGPAARGSRRPRHRPVRRVPARGRRARRDREHRRPGVPGDAPLGRGRARTASPASRCSRSRPAPTSSQAGDVMWVDTGINLHGYASDFGATWIVGRDARRDRARPVRPLARDVVDRALGARASRARPRPTSSRRPRLDDGRRPWLSYFYLAHGVGTDSAEMPFVGTDLGDAFDASLDAAAGHGARVRARRVGRRPRRAPLRGDRRGHRRRLRASSRRRAELDAGRVREPARGVPRADGARRHRRARCSAGRRTRAPSPTRRGCGSRGPGRSRPVASSCGERAPCTCSPTPTPSSRPASRSIASTASRGIPRSCSPRSPRSTGSRDARRVAVDGMTPDGERAARARDPRRRARRRGPVVRRAVARRPIPSSIGGRRARRPRSRPTGWPRWSPRSQPGVLPRELRGMCAAAFAALGRDDARVRSRRRAVRSPSRRAGCRPSARSSTTSGSCCARACCATAGKRRSPARTRSARRRSTARARGLARRWSPRAAPGTTVGALRGPGRRRQRRRARRRALARRPRPRPRPHGRDRAPRRPQPPPGHRPHHRLNPPTVGGKSGPRDAGIPRQLLAGFQGWIWLRPRSTIFMRRDSMLAGSKPGPSHSRLTRASIFQPSSTVVPVTSS